MNTVPTTALSLRDPWTLVPSIGNLDAYITAVNRLPMPPFFAGLLPTPESTIISFVLLGLIAVGAAMYPANKAARVDPPNVAV